MSLHRLLGFRAAVADPAALGAYYAELGLTGGAASGYTGSDGGATVIVDAAPFRRLIAVDIGCDDDRDLDAVQQRLEARGASPARGSESVSVIDDASRVQFTVRVAEPEMAGPSVGCVAPNAPGSVVRVERARAGCVRRAARSTPSRPSRDRNP